MDKEKMMELQLLEQQLQTIGQNVEALDNNLGELKGVHKNIDEFKDLKKGDKILVPLANGLFASATLNDSKHLKVNVGASVMVTKDLEGAKNIISEQVSELEKYKSEAEKYYQELYSKMALMQQELMKEETLNK